MTKTKRYLILALAVVIMAAFCFYSGYKKGISTEQVKQTSKELTLTQKALSEFAVEARRLNGLSAKIQEQTDALAKQTKTHTVEYRTYEKLVPLPDNCRPDAIRLQHIDSAISDANTLLSGQPDAPVSTD